MSYSKSFVPALIVVDVQNDFCPPNGSLAVPDGRDIIPHVNHLLSLPFSLKLLTRDWHPANHISFASNHPDSPQPFTSTITIKHPDDPSKTYETTLWPVHCVQGTWGAEPPEGLDVHKADGIVKKGLNEKVEMYSAFQDPWGVEITGLAERLRERNVTDVFVVGLAGDICAKETAKGAVKEKFKTWFVEEGAKPVDVSKWEACKREMAADGIAVVSIDGDEVQRVATLNS